MKLTLMAFVLMMLTTAAFAEPPRRGDGWKGGDRHHHSQRYGHGYRGPRVDPGTAFAGAVIGSWLWRQFNPPPVVIQAQPQALAPWTPEWYTFCTGRYRSFNPQTGYYMGYDGNPHFCR
jgi:hypothetical protein